MNHPSHNADNLSITPEQFQMLSNQLIDIIEADPVGLEHYTKLINDEASTQRIQNFISFAQEEDINIAETFSNSLITDKKQREQKLLQTADESLQHINTQRMRKIATFLDDKRMTIKKLIQDGQQQGIDSQQRQQQIKKRERAGLLLIAPTISIKNFFVYAKIFNKKRIRTFKKQTGIGLALSSLATISIAGHIISQQVYNQQTEDRKRLILLIFGYGLIKDIKKHKKTKNMETKKSIEMGLGEIFQTKKHHQQ